MDKLESPQAIDPGGRSAAASISISTSASAGKQTHLIGWLPRDLEIDMPPEISPSIGESAQAPLARFHRFGLVRSAGALDEQPRRCLGRHRWQPESGAIAGSAADLQSTVQKFDQRELTIFAGSTTPMDKPHTVDIWRAFRATAERGRSPSAATDGGWKVEAHFAMAAYSAEGLKPGMCRLHRGDIAARQRDTRCARRSVTAPEKPR
jgi:hypothetical protein